MTAVCGKRLLRYTLSALGICLLGLIIYSNTFRSPFFFDDFSGIVNNSSIKNLHNLKSIFNFWPPRFITHLSFAVNYHFSRLDVFGYHLLNIIIHLGSSILTWLFCLAVFSTPAMRKERITSHKYLISLFAGLIFAVHPVQTQAVTYIIQRAASLATFFYLASLFFYIRSRLSNPAINSRNFYYFLSLLSAIVAMSTKEITITLPLMIILIEYCLFKKEMGINWKRTYPFLSMLLIIPAALLTAGLIDSPGMKMTSGYLPAIRTVNYILTEPRVIVTYIRLLFVPVNQNLDYDYPIAKSLLELPVLYSLLLIIIIVIIAFRAYPKFRLISFGIFWFFLTILPESSIMPLQDVIFEHRLYLPMAGFSIFLASIAYYAIGRKNLFSMTLILGLIINWYAVSTYNRNFYWKDGITLWNDTIGKSPNKAGPYVSRGIVYIQRKEFDKAMFDFNRALRIDNNYPQAHNGQGVVYGNRGEYESAVSAFTRALNLDAKYAEAYCNRGLAYTAKKDYVKAEEDFNRVLNVYPNYTPAYISLGKLYSQTNKYLEALAQYNNALRLEPASLEVHSAIIALYSDMGENDLVIEFCRKALDIDPKYAPAYINLGVAYGMVGDFMNAIKYSKMGVALDQNSALAHYNLSVAYYYIREYALAIKHCNVAIRLNYPVSSDYLEALKPYSK
ncbi:MAG: tetratricopeptide repeat protein [Candidatus Omnitrophota bacterium]|nr:tetratricopeptide repeat protein [Candidatus Omnitrophota bacterium]MBU1929463.1 tetratricopeptide repeat protein [Candidatus Omnitrophota bacterium]MBU2034688.1 tetratricopeptide repeat protein [Candidatus Omnitrophota bacterium]MBU2221310.1 tetratricopeptide repeat protein [Candidatus Omnitrophota bacterium]MBU2257878.1 tetratricopeptide repeat protein [Candidatus Omnitrophota bacterium]